MEIRAELNTRATEYLSNIPELEGQSPPMLLVDFVMEKFMQHRNYPSNFTEDKIAADMRKYLSTMTMAVIDIFMKIGAEGEKSHSDSGISRTYENAYISLSVFNDVLPYVKIL